MTEEHARGGIVIVDKPAGMTSHDVVAKVRRLAGTRRVGHAGTLDPMATGVLVLGIERATRLLTYLVADDKDYLATIRLGQSTITDDAQGQILASIDATHLRDEEVAQAIHGLTGDIQQRPSAVSAIKVDGQRSYARVRSGQEVQLPPRPVTVSEFTVEQVRRIGSVIDLDVAVTVSSGTYVRALARDLGQALGVGGHLTKLRRTRSGAMTLSMAMNLEQMQEHWTMISLDDAVAAALPAISISAADAAAVLHGRRVATSADEGHTVGVFSPEGQALAISTVREGLLVPDVVFS